MKEHEFAEVLQHLQRRMQEYGFGELADRIISDIHLDAGQPSSQLMRYLNALESELLLGTDQTLRVIIARLNGTLDSGNVDGVRLVMSEVDQDLYGIDSIDLGRTPDLDSLIADLRSLRGELAESRER